MIVQQLYTEGTYNVGYNICAVLLSLLILFFFLHRSQFNRLSDRSIIEITVLMIIGCASETVVLLMRNNPALYAPLACDILTFLYHLAYNSEPYFILIYALSLTRLEHNWPKKQVYWMGIPLYAMIAMMLIPPVRHQIYHRDPVHPATVVHGPLYPVFYVIIAIYAISLLIMIIRSRKAFGRRLIPTIILYLMSYVTVLVQLISPYLKASRFLQALCIFSVFMVFVEDDPGKDFTTGLFNHYALLNDIQIALTAEFHVAVITVKIINLPYYRTVFSVRRVNHIIRQSADWLKNRYASRSTYLYSTANSTLTLLIYDPNRDNVIEKAEEIRREFPKRWHSADSHMDIRAQVWVAFIPEQVSTTDQLNVFLDADADPALDSDRVCFADETTRASRWVAVEQAIERNLKDSTLQVYYQPIYDLSSGTFRSAEALVRMFDKKLGFVSPEEFIRIAESNDTINAIGEFVFNDVCRFISEKQPSRYGLKFIEINLSPVQCMDAHLADRFRRILDTWHVSASEINLEITESAFITDSDFIRQTVKNLKQMGFTFSMDDFGTGYANYSKMMDLPFNIVKIDKSILQAASDHPENEPVLRGSVRMCSDLNRKVLVEGVETEAQRDLLLGMGVDYLQGYLYSRPVPEADFFEFLKKNGNRQPGEAPI